jgi:hypothetical protein
MKAADRGDDTPDSHDRDNMKIAQNGWTRWLGAPLTAALVCGIVSLPGVAVGPRTPVQEMPREAAPPAEIWSKHVWRSALESDSAGVDSFAALYKTLPSEAGDGDAVVHFQESVQLRRSNRDKARMARSEARDEAIEQMREHVAAEALSPALRSAVEVQTLSDDLDSALKDPGLRHIITWAERQLPEIERERDWLLAQELLFRLRTIYDGTSAVEEYQRLDDHLERVNRRVMLLARYAPKRLHELRSVRAQRQGEEPLGDFNPALIEDWRERNRNVNHRIVKSALKTAAADHIESQGWRPLLRGGLEALKLFATTTALKETFPLLGEAEPVNAWRRGIDGELLQLEQTPDDDLTAWSLGQVLDGVINVRAGSVFRDHLAASVPPFHSDDEGEFHRRGHRDPPRRGPRDSRGEPAGGYAGLFRGRQAQRSDRRGRWRVDGWLEPQRRRRQDHRPQGHGGHAGHEARGCRGSDPTDDRARRHQDPYSQGLVEAGAR